MRHSRRVHTSRRRAHPVHVEVTQLGKLAAHLLQSIALFRIRIVQAPPLLFQPMQSTDNKRSSYASVLAARAQPRCIWTYLRSDNTTACSSSVVAVSATGAHSVFRNEGP